MKIIRRLKFTILYLSIFAISIGTDYAQTPEIFWNSTKIPLNGFVALECRIPIEHKKDFTIYFPEIEDFYKDRTISKKHKEPGEQKYYHVVQFYRPSKQGEFYLPAHSFKVKGQVYTAKEVYLHVGPADENYSNPDYEEINAENLNFTEEKVDAFLQLTVSKSKPYAGERFKAELIFYIAANNKAEITFFNLQEQISELRKKLKPKNCIIDEFLVSKEEIEHDTTTINNKLYTRLILYKAYLYGIDTTEIKFPGCQFSVVTYKTARNGNTSTERKAVHKTFPSGAISLHVKPLPPHPLRDKVPVGVYELKEDISSRNAYPGNNIQYTFTIYGEGGLSSVMIPEIIQHPALDIFYPIITQSQVEINGRRKINKSFTYHMVPKVEGNYRLNQHLLWIYFNPVKQNYDTLRPRINFVVYSSKDNNALTEEHSTFYDQIFKENNKLRSNQKDKTVNFFANLIILFMLVFTAILIFRK